MKTTASGTTPLSELKNPQIARPTFIMSFDCEGKWGMMDDLGIHSQLTSRGLEAAYQQLCDLLSRYGIRATFAFVAAFSMSEEEVRSKIALFKEVGPLTQDWLKPFMMDLEACRTDGWLAPQAFSTVEKAGAHEIASHGFSHLPVHGGAQGREEFSRELQSVYKTNAFVARNSLTFVYPRNQIGFTEDLPGHGFLGYRDSISLRKDKPPLNWKCFLDELNPFPKAQTHTKNMRIVAPIPAGRFLNWRSGLRARIPVQWTVSTWRRIIDDSIENGGVVHLWSHPHNFVTGKDMFILLEEILKIASQRIRAGELWNLTMKEYVESLRRGR